MSKINTEIAVAYLDGKTIQVNYNGNFGFSKDAWLDIPAYEEPKDMLRFSCPAYSFRIKPNE